MGAARLAATPLPENTMNRTRLVALSALALLPFMPGCYISGGHGSTYRAQPGNVTFNWAFEGRTCGQERAIQYVLVEIPGEKLAGNGYFYCRNDGYDGITLHDFAPGTYNYTLTAIDYDGYESYAGYGSFTVDGDVSVYDNLSYNG